MNFWELIKLGRFEEACNKADIEYKITGDISLIRNKIIALLHLKQYDKVVLLANKCIELRNEETDTDFIKCGIAYWFLNKKGAAIEIWKRGERCKYTDAAGGIEIRIIEYFASVKTENDDLKNETILAIKRLVKNKLALNWPGPLGNYLLGEITDIELLKFISNKPILRERNLCQMNFTIAIKELEKGNITAYKNKLQESIKDETLSYLEDIYYLAKGEIGLL